MLCKQHFWTRSVDVRQLSPPGNSPGLLSTTYIVRVVHLTHSNRPVFYCYFFFFYIYLWRNIRRDNVYFDANASYTGNANATGYKTGMSRLCARPYTTHWCPRLKQTNAICVKPLMGHSKCDYKFTNIVNI